MNHDATVAANPTPLLMIPGPIEISPVVLSAAAQPPQSHVSPGFIASFGAALGDLRRVVCADADAQPIVVAGSGTLAMEMAATNVVGPGEHVVVVSTGYFSDRMAEMLRRRGAVVTEVAGSLGDVPTLGAIEAAITSATVAVFATHVDTSTGVRVDPQPLARLARERGLVSVFDGVCAAGAERLAMADWGVDVVLTASQKALGLPVGLGLLVVSPQALARRQALRSPPPLTLDWQSWLPIMRAYEAGQPSYFATPATTLIVALQAGLAELLSADPDPVAAMAIVHARQERVALAMRAAFAVLGLQLLPAHDEIAAFTLSALRYPLRANGEQVGIELVGAIGRHGVAVAGGLHPAIKGSYFRVGHMGYVTTRPDWLERTVVAIGSSLAAVGAPADTAAAVAALGAGLR